MASVSEAPDGVPEVYRALEYFPDPQFPLHVECHPQGAQVPMHAHDFVEIVVVRAGSGQHVMDAGDGSERCSTIAAGDAFVVMPGERHGYRNSGSLQLANILFCEGFVAGEAPDLEALPGLGEVFVWGPIARTSGGERGVIALSGAARSTAEGVIDALIAEQRLARSGSLVMLKALFLELVVVLCRAAEDGRDVHDPVVTAAIAFMQDSFAEAVQLHQIAAHVVLSSGHFSQRFRSATGISPWEYLLRLRIDAAKQLLRDSRLGITEIALAVGFADHSHLTKAFRRREAMTPSAYRRSVGSDQTGT